MAIIESYYNQELVRHIILGIDCGTDPFIADQTKQRISLVSSLLSTLITQPIQSTRHHIHVLPSYISAGIQSGDKVGA
jgi:hypothetical protein